MQKIHLEKKDNNINVTIEQGNLLGFKPGNMDINSFFSTKAKYTYFGFNTSHD